MAETAGLAIGVVGLWTVFNSCVELAAQIKDARNLGKDYESKITTLMLLERRLRNCQTKQVMQQNPHELPHTGDHNEHHLAARALVEIQRRLEKINKMLNKYDNPQRQHHLMHVASGATQGHSLQETTEYIREAASQRQRTVSLLRKASWAMNHNGALERAIGEVEGFVIQLEKLAEGSSSVIEPSSGTPDHTCLTTPPLLLVDDPGTGQTTDVHQLGMPYSNHGHTYQGNNVTGRARVTQGDVGPEMLSGARNHVYVGNKISGYARVLQGNTSSVDMRSFWDD